MYMYKNDNQSLNLCSDYSLSSLSRFRFDSFVCKHSKITELIWIKVRRGKDYLCSIGVRFEITLNRIESITE